MERTDDVATMKEKYSKLGIFTIELWRSKIVLATESTHNFKVDALGPVPEKALKGQALDVVTTCVARTIRRYHLLMLLLGSKLPQGRGLVA